jgi:hypothetical protein
MAFASVADAGTVLRTQSPAVQNSVNNVYNTVTNTNYVNHGTVDLGEYNINNVYGNNWSSTYNANFACYSTAKNYLNTTIKSYMQNDGWSFVSSYNTSASGNRTFQHDKYQKTVTTTTVETTVEKNVTVNSSPIEYRMEDGVLVAVKSSSVTNNVTTTNNVTVDSTTYTKTVVASGEPITLDTTNTGKITTANHEWLMHAPKFYGEFASKFDFTGDGIADKCEWLSDNPDALLCMPVNGQINGVTELFGNLGGYANGFDKLSVLCDKDGNGIVEGNELEGLMLWVDSNRNGVADAGELKTLDSYGITKFYTDHKDFVGKYETSDGQTHTMWAWFPSLQQ